MYETQIPIKVAFSRRRIFKRRLWMDDETGESSNFKKLEEGFRSFVVIEKKYSCLFVAICTHNHVITYVLKVFTSSQK